MTLPALILLLKIRKVQRSNDGWAWIDDESYTITTVTEGNVFGESKRNTIKLANKWDSLFSIIEYLQAEGLLEFREKTNHIRLNHKGYHYFQSVVLSFLLKSIVVPIIVALGTTLITLWIQAQCLK